MKITLTKKELAVIYQVSYGTFLRWLKQIPELSENNISKRRLLTPKDIKIIYSELGEP